MTPNTANTCRCGSACTEGNVEARDHRPAAARPLECACGASCGCGAGCACGRE